MIGQLLGAAAVACSAWFGAPFLSVLENLALGHSVYDLQAAVEAADENGCQTRMRHTLENRA